MVSYTDLPLQQLTKSTEIDEPGEISEHPHGGAQPNTAPKDPTSSAQVSDKKYNHKLRWQRNTPAPIIISSPAIKTKDFEAIEILVKKLVQDLKSPSVDIAREATSELRILSKEDVNNRVLIASCGAITQLIDLLHSSDLMTQEYAVTTLLNLSLNDNNKIVIAGSDAIEPLIHVLQTGSPEAKENSAATLYSLSIYKDNKLRIGNSGAIGPLVDLLGNGTPRGKKDAATALYNLSTCTENILGIVNSGAVKHLIDLMDPATGMVDRAVVVLANLASVGEGRTAIVQARGVPLLVEALELGSARGKENATAALVHLCTHSNRCCRMVLEEGAMPPLVALSKLGTPRAKEKANRLLSLLRNLHRNYARRG